MMTDQIIEEAMELITPPSPVPVDGMPQKANPAEIQALQQKVDRRRFFGWLAPKSSIALAAARYSEACAGGGYYANNCAHFLSNAFIEAGYTRLKRSRIISRSARCYIYKAPQYPQCSSTGGRRPVRAKEMEKWFRSKATKKKDLSRTAGDTVQERYASIKNTGFWAIFQRQPGGYPGGHVCVIDTNNWNYFGTGSDGYWDWELQHLYKW